MLKADERHGTKAIVVMTVLGIMALIGIMMLTGNSGQAYNDVLTGYTSIDGSNKSVEITMIYALGIVGAAIYLAWYLFDVYKNPYFQIQDGAKHVIKNYVAGISIAVSAVAGILFKASYNAVIVLAVVLLLILIFIAKDRISDCMIMYCALIYALCGLYRLFSLAGGKGSISLWIVALVSGAVSFGCILHEKRTGVTIAHRIVMIAQLFTPLCLLIFFSYRYLYNNQFVSVRIPTRVALIIFLVIVSFYVEIISIIRKKWNESDISIGDVISCGLCISVMVFNRYSGRGAIMPQDGHHQFEDVIGFSQIFELGQKPFDAYIPVSGMYSVVQGFFLSLFGHGQLGNYYVTTNLFYLCVVILTVILLRKQLSGCWLLYVSLFYLVIDYNRVAFIVPIMLLLMSKQIIQKKNLWLKLWVLTSLFGGLYYPVFGAAVCLGYLPMGIWQLATYVREHQLMQDAVKLRFYIEWICCFALIILAVPLLLGTLKHTLAMSGQTIFVDGLSRFGQAVPKDFMPYISSMVFRLVCFDVLTFMPLIIIIWISVAIALKTGGVGVKNKKLCVNNPQDLFRVISLSIFIIVSVSYTAVRLDMDTLYSRNTGLIYSAFVIMVVWVCQYYQKDKVAYAVIGLVVFFLSVNSMEGFNSISSNSKLDPYYSVSDQSVYIQNDPVEKLGQGFMSQSVYDEIESTYDNYRRLDKNQDYLALCNFGMAYLCDIKGASTLEASTICGYEAARETVDLLQKRHSNVGGMVSPTGCYYLYHWLLTSGNYCWSYDDGYFKYNESGLSKEQVLDNNRIIAMNYGVDGGDTVNTPASWGESFDSLSALFREPEIKYSVLSEDDGTEIVFDNKIDGDEADFLYIEFDDSNENIGYSLISNHKESRIVSEDDGFMLKGLLKKEYNYGSKVCVSWNDNEGKERHLQCNQGKGTLLVQLGGEIGWLLNEHSSISIHVENGESTVSMPAIHKIRLLKLREIE